jgi:hypothetical protein
MGRVQNYLAAKASYAALAVNEQIRADVASRGTDAALSRAAQMVPPISASLGGGATMWAREEAARQSPDYQLRTKTWIADTGRHAEFDGDTVAIGDDWPGGFAPGSPPNCRCSMSIS